MLKILLVTISVVLAVPNVFGTDIPEAVFLDPADTVTQATPGSRESFRPRNDEERALAKHFSRFNPGGKPLQPGQIVGAGHSEYGPPPLVRPANAFDELRAAVCKTDLIVTGERLASRVLLNAPETFFVTIYDFRVDVSARTSLTPGTTIRIALAGGEAILEGQKTTALQLSELPGDVTAIVWLKRIQGTTVYELATDVGVLTFKGEQPRSSIPTQIELVQKRDTLGNFWTAISNAAATCGRRP